MRRLAVAAAAAFAIGCAAPVQHVEIQSPPAAVAFDPVGVYDFTTQAEGTSIAGVLTIAGTPRGG